jgi:hypothetical protein
LLYPQQSQVRNVLDTSGLWQFQLDPQEQGEVHGWLRALPAPRPIAVPCSWNDLFDDARDYLGLAWYLTDVWVPSGWGGQRVFLRIGSANVIASDKTGTLTKNEVTVRVVVTTSGRVSLGGTGCTPEGEVRRDRESDLWGYVCLHIAKPLCCSRGLHVIG